MLTFKENHILQHLDNVEKTWAVPDLLESYDPLSGEPLAERNAAIRQILPLAEELYPDLSDAARLRYDFWKQLKPARIPVEHWKYTTKISETYHWELTLTPEGIYYKDVSGVYWNPPGRVSEQLLSDFWFSGPLLPIPDLKTRQWLVAHIRNAFLQAGSPASYAHFKLFEYPPLENPVLWEEGDHKAQDYVCLRQYGIETGRTTWYDGLVWLNFLSFERFLTDPTAYQAYLTPKIREEINRHLTPAPIPEQMREVALLPHWMDEHGADPPYDNSRSKQLFMENGGQVHQIYKDGWGDVYRASVAEEDAWREELIANYKRRIELEDDGVVLTLVARTLQQNRVKNVEELLLAAEAKTPSLKAKQAYAQALHEVFNHDKAAEILIDLLQYGEEESYWRNYVFNMFYRMRENRGVQQFLIECLRGDHEVHFKKAVDVLVFWGLHLGEEALANRDLLLALNWEDACANDPDFRKALGKVIKIIES